MSESAKKFSIYAGLPVDRLLKVGDNRSGRINTAVERYLLVCKRELPGLTKNEWLVVMDALNATVLTADMIPYLPQEIEDAMEYDRLDEKWEINGDALVQNLKGLSTSGLVALCEAFERWWAAEGDNQARFKAAGIRPVSEDAGRS